MKTICPHCQQHYELDAQYEGQNAECTTCGKEFVIENSSPLTSENLTVPETNRQSLRTQKAASQQHEPSKRKSAKFRKVIIICCGLLSLIYIYKHLENSERKFTEDISAKNEKLIKEAVLSVAQYPASSEVVIEIYSDLTNSIHCSGYADFANGFGVKTRYKFWFPKITPCVVYPRKCFGLFGGQKDIRYDSNLGTFSLTPPGGVSKYFNAGTGKEISSEDFDYDR